MNVLKIKTYKKSKKKLNILTLIILLGQNMFVD